MSKEKRKRDKEMRRLYDEHGVPEFYGKQDLPIFRNKQVKAREHLLTGAYIDVRDRNKAERNAEMRRL